MMILNYSSRKELKENIGKPLDYQETCTRFGFPAEYRSTGSFAGSNRPQMIGEGDIDDEGFHSLIKRRGGVGKKGREFFATVVMENDLIKEVS
jgi:hypothetical protein